MNNNLILCGGIIQQGTFCEVRCDIQTGELSYRSEYDGISFVVGEVTVDDPISLPSIQALEKVVQNNGLLGLVYTKHGALAMLNEYVAEWRPVTALTVTTGQTFAIDTRIEIE